jgi:hypothetical protein
MKQLLIIIAIIVAVLTQASVAQEKKDPASKEKGMEKKAAAQKDKKEKKEMAMEAGTEMMPPSSLDNDPWMSWMVGEWEGTSESPMGTSNDWMKLELALGGQFCIAHYKSEVVTVNKEMAEAMGMTEEQMKMPYSGMGVFTVDPKTGKSINYWFGSMRDISTGKGSREGNIETTEWKSKMGTEVRTVEKVNENEMVMTFKMTMGDSDEVMEGKTVLKRKM